MGQFSNSSSKMGVLSKYIIDAMSDMVFDVMFGVNFTNSAFNASNVCCDRNNLALNLFH